MIFWVTARYLAKITGTIVSFYREFGFSLQVYAKAIASDYFFQKIMGYSFETEQRIYCRLEFLEIELYEFTI